MKATLTFCLLFGIHTLAPAQAQSQNITSEKNLTSDESQAILEAIDTLRDRTIEHPRAIEILEAAQTSEDVQVQNALKQFNSDMKRSTPLAQWLPALHGGNADKGKQLVQQHCNSCHQGTEEANKLGPDLTGIFTKLDHFREDLLTALVIPSDSITPGYGSIIVEFQQGQVTGKLLAYQATGIVVEIKGKARLISHSDYTNVSFEKSTMPAVQDTLSIREIRDVVAYLSTLTGEPNITKVSATPFSIDELDKTDLETKVDVEVIQKLLYESNCAACHQTEGQGNQGFPPLANSEWVSGDKETLIKIQLLGLSGPIKVGNIIYDGVPMPSSAHLKDEEIAHILTYIRTNPIFGNKSTEVFEEEIVETRAAIADQEGPLDASTLQHPSLSEPNKMLPKKQDNKSTSYLIYLIGFIILCLIPVVIGFFRNNKPASNN